MAEIIPSLLDLLGKVSVAKDLAQTAKSANDFATQAPVMKQLYTSLTDFMGAFTIGSPALKLVIGEISVATAQERAKVMIDLLQLVQSAPVQEGIKIIGEVLNIILQGLDALTQGLTWLGSLHTATSSMASDIDTTASALSVLASNMQLLTGDCNTLINTVQPPTSSPVQQNASFQQVTTWNFNLNDLGLNNNKFI